MGLNLSSVESASPQMIRILAAGIPDQFVFWLDQNLDTAEIEPAYSVDDALEMMEQEEWALAIIDSSLPGISLDEVIGWIRNELELFDLPIICCLDGDVSDASTSHLTQMIGKDNVVRHPLDVDDMCRRIKAILDSATHLDSEETTADIDGTSPQGHEDVHHRRQLVREALADIWEEFQDANLRHITALENIAGSLGNKTIEEPMILHTRKQSQELAKSLMSFGLLEDAALAQEIEVMLGDSSWPNRDKAEHLSELTSALKTALLETYANELPDTVQNSGAQLEGRNLV